MASSFDRIFADVRKDIPSVTDAVLRQEVFRVMDDFTQTTNIWQEGLPVAVKADTQAYNLVPATGKPSRLLLVYEDRPEPSYSWPVNGVSMRVPGVLMVHHKPTIDVNWIAVVAKRTAEPLSADRYPMIDDWIVDKYADTIGRGVLARLQFEPQKPYSNPMIAQVNQRAYISGRSLARTNDMHGNVYNAQSWRFPSGWGTTNRKGFV